MFENCVRVNIIGQLQNGGHYFDVFNGLTSSFRTPGKPYVTMQCRFMSNQSEAASFLCKPIRANL